MKNKKQVKNSCSEENNDAKQNNSINNFSEDLASKDPKKNETAKGLENDSESGSKDNSETVAENDLPALSDEENGNEFSEKKESENESPSEKEYKEKRESPEKGKIKKELKEEKAGNSEDDKNPAGESNSEDDKNPAEEGNSEDDKNPAEEGNSEEEENEPEGILSLWRSRDKSSVSPAELLRRHSEGNSETAKQLAESLSRIQAFCNGSQITAEALDKALEIMFD
ncbi:MAG: hypothetical protein K2F64_02505, partial [Muribaculaceae bacterium]|nr:hypothetical protein [Muribaculaceae bacterium]